MGSSRGLLLLLGIVLVSMGCSHVTDGVKDEEGGDEECRGNKTETLVAQTTSGTRCEWKTTGDVDVKFCTVTYVTISGDGTKPDTMSITVGRKDSPKDAETDNRSPNGSDGSWSYPTTALNCSTVDCGVGRYYVYIKNQSGGSCSDHGNLTVTVQAE